MAKYYGKIGYATAEETAPGVWVNTITERYYSGDVMRRISKWDNGQGLNDDMNINNQISIVADPIAYQHVSDMRYIEWLGTLWKITSIEISNPRLILTIGGVWNGETP